MNEADLIGTEGLEGRSAPELTALLFELGQVLKARRFYPGGDARFVRLFGRVLRGWQADLARHGALEIEVDARGFRAPPTRERLAPAQLSDLLGDLSRRGVGRLILEEDIDADAFAGLVETLAAPLEVLEAEGGVVVALHSRVAGGIRIDSAWGATQTQQLGPPDEGAMVPEAGFAKPLGVAGASVSEPDPELFELEALLADLEACQEAPRYQDLARRAVQLANRAVAVGRIPLARIVVLALSRHVAEGPKRPERQADIARDFLLPLASGPMLDALVESAGDADPNARVPSCQVLLQLGREAVPTLLRAAVLERNEPRLVRLHGILIELGEKALPELLDSLESEHPEVVRCAVQLLGEIGSPESVPRLAALLLAEDDPVWRDAARALARIGGAAAVGALGSALGAGRPELTSLAVQCLGLTDTPRNVGPLTEAIELSLRSGPVSMGREAIRALGRQGRPEAARPLTRLLERNGLRHRKRLRDLKTAAVAALGTLPGDEAVAALARVVGARDMKLRRAAQSALERRARSLASLSD